MTPNADPWRTLGLAPGASADEVRRAYRRLAKANHPDAAGETALPRFLAIQAAYEQLVGATVRRRPGSRPGGARSAPAEPWRADPDRARASGRADGRRPGARPAGGRRGAGASAEERPAAGAPDGETAPGAGRRSRAGGAGGAGAAGGAGGAGPAGEGPARGRRGGGRRRAPNKAGPYSTSYDPADEEPFEPGWSGGSWYGTSSGTYWTINPKEYADPRKHGPEYQRRARRSAGGGGILDENGEPTERVGPEDESAAGAPGAPPPFDGAEPRTDADVRSRATRTRVRPPGGEAAGAGAGAPPFVRAQRPGDSTSGNPGLPRLRAPTTSAGRLAIALIGWPPLGLAAATAIGESSGCGRFAASCGELSSPGTWIVQAAILILLLALPRVAAWSAHGALAALVVGAPAAVVLSAGGGARQPETSASVLTIVVVAAYVLGIVYAIAAPRWGDRSRVP